MTSKCRRTDVDATSLRRIDVSTMSLRRDVPAGGCFFMSYGKMLSRSFLADKIIME